MLVTGGFCFWRAYFTGTAHNAMSWLEPFVQDLLSDIQAHLSDVPACSVGLSIAKSWLFAFFASSFSQFSRLAAKCTHTSQWQGRLMPRAAFFLSVPRNTRQPWLNATRQSQPRFSERFRATQGDHHARFPLRWPWPVLRSNREALPLLGRRQRTSSVHFAPSGAPGFLRNMCLLGWPSI